MGVGVAHKAQPKTITIPEIIQQQITIRLLRHISNDPQHDIKNVLLMMLRHVNFK